MAKEFKSFNNPALQFFSGVEEEEPKQEQPQIQPPVIRKKKERKSKRLNLLIYPSVYEACKREADEQGESINEIINFILKDYFTKER